MDRHASLNVVSKIMIEANTREFTEKPHQCIWICLTNYLCIILKNASLKAFCVFHSMQLLNDWQSCKVTQMHSWVAYSKEDYLSKEYQLWDCVIFEMTQIDRYTFCGCAWRLKNKQLVCSISYCKMPVSVWDIEREYDIQTVATPRKDKKIHNVIKSPGIQVLLWGTAIARRTREVTHENNTWGPTDNHKTILMSL